jgi:hypothetical protein
MPETEDPTARRGRELVLAELMEMVADRIQSKEVMDWVYDYNLPDVRRLIDELLGEDEPADARVVMNPEGCTVALTEEREQLFNHTAEDYQKPWPFREPDPGPQTKPFRWVDWVLLVAILILLCVVAASVYNVG